eukprot:m.100798 g.100798  ORF g.100798 m.100798 type:complete len:75 (-) comp13183_c0_seq3:3557-3781(-)
MKNEAKQSSIMDHVASRNSSLSHFHMQQNKEGIQQSRQVVKEQSSVISAALHLERKKKKEGGERKNIQVHGSNE